MRMLKRIMMILLVFTLVISMVPAAFAAGENDAYVLARPNYGSTMKNRQFASPYGVQFSFDNGTTLSTIQTCLYTMYHKTTQAVFPVYCLDINVGAYTGIDYRRLNLEESTYSASTAGQIRAIVRNGFYVSQIEGEDDKETVARAKTAAKNLGEAAGVANLTVGEAITATQCALWRTAHGPVLSFTSFTNFLDGNTAELRYLDLFKSEYESVSETDLPAINDRIRTVYDYLLALPPAGPNKSAASAASFISISEPVCGEIDAYMGTCDITVKATVNVQLRSEKDSLAVSGTALDTYIDALSYSNSVKLVGGIQDVTLTFEDVYPDMVDNIKLIISGVQTASDVFMFDAYGGREKAQTMVAMDDSLLPVYVEVPAQISRIFNIRKTTSAKVPLEGIVFDIFPVSDDVYLQYKDNPAQCPHAALATYTLITDSDGWASLNLTNYGLKDGIYLVVERQHPAIVATLAPFFVSIPAVDTENNELDYEVTVRPKNEVKGHVNIDKDVISLGNDEASVDAGVDHTWIISTTIPEDITQGKSYVISDTLDSSLDYVDDPDNDQDDLRVTVETVDGQTIVAFLEADTDYIFTLNDQDSLAEGNPADSFTIQLTAAGRAAVANAVTNAEGSNSFSDYRIRVRFTARINANAEPAEKIPNQSTVTYKNSLNFDFQAQSDRPEVYMGAVNLVKVDAKNHDKILPGAVFEVYRNATQEEVAAGGDNLVTLEGMQARMIKVAFYDNPAMTGDKVTEGTTDENGELAIYGLAYGNYYLLETKAPTGYNQTNTPIPLTIGENTHLEANAVMIENSGNSVILPTTGGTGTTAYTFWGTALVAMSLLLILEKKRRTVAN